MKTCLFSIAAVAGVLAGGAANAAPDGNGVGRDWVETCDAQFEIDRCLNEARSALR